MAEEKLLTLNVRKEIAKATRVKKANTFVKILRKKIQKMFKEQRVIIDKSVNEKIWERSIKKPPAKLRLKVTKIDDKTVKVELGK